VEQRAESVLVFDGDCAFCSSSVQWVSKRWKEDRRCVAVASQSLDDQRLAAMSLSRRDVAQAVWWIEDGRLFRGHLAVAKALSACAPPWNLVGMALARRPWRWLAAGVYPIVVHNRGRLSRGPQTCARVR